MIDLTKISKRIPDLTSKKEVAGEAKIRFYCNPEDYGAYPPPTPAHEELPPWFKSVKRSTDDMGLSVKACQPFYDAMSRGWIIKTPAEMMVRVLSDENEIQVKHQENSQWISTSSNHVDQLGDEFPSKQNIVLFQFKIPWTVETAEGYSLFLLPALNRPDPRFQAFAGIIDTDEYPRALNCVCMWTMPNFQGKIERGTPIATVMPIKRDELGGTAKVEPGSEDDLLRRERFKRRVKRSHLYEGYRKEVWSVKPTPSADYDGDDEYGP